MEKEKRINYYRASAMEDYISTPLSVIKYITILEIELGLPPDEDVVTDGILPYNR